MRTFKSFRAPNSDTVMRKMYVLLDEIYHIVRSRSPSWWFKTLAVTFTLYFCHIFVHGEKKDPLFDQSFCDEYRNCHEKPYEASPRSYFSSRTRKQYNDWWKYFETLNKRAEMYAKRRQSSPQAILEKRPLILLGDSITEAWSGTSYGKSKTRTKGIPRVLDELLNTPFLDPLVLGISGDQTQHLLYRLQNGHMTAAQIFDRNTNSIVYDPSAIFVVMIGTNNIGAGELPGPTAKGILAVVEFLLQQTAGSRCNVLLLKVLPRNDFPLQFLSNNTKRTYYTSTFFTSSFLPAIHEVNEELSKGVKKLSQQYPDNFDPAAPSRIHLLDCGTPFENNINELMPDHLHPNAAGHHVMAECMRRSILELFNV